MEDNNICEEFKKAVSYEDLFHLYELSHKSFMEMLSYAEILSTELVKAKWYYTEGEE